MVSVPHQLSRALSVIDIRFPTSLEKDGSDASTMAQRISSANADPLLVNKSPDYSGAFVILHTNHPNLKAYGTFRFLFLYLLILT
jgi:hypothetical protein